MKAKRFRLVLIAVAVLSMISAYTARAWKQDPIDQSATRVRPIENARENMIRNQLGSLLRNLGVNVGEVPPETSDHKRLMVRWQSGLNSADSYVADLPQSRGVLTFTNSPARAGSVPRPRSLELATNQLLVIGVDEDQQLQWWHQFHDPRILRAEVPDESGRQNIGRTFYLNQADFTVAYPNNPAINELRFYHPTWTGKEFQLELIGAVSVR